MRRYILLGFAIIFAITSFATATRIFGQNGVWQTYNRANSEINADTVTVVGFDPTDGVWSETRYGAQSFINNVWTDYVDLKKITSKDIWDIENVNGTIYFGTRSTLASFDGSTWKSYDVTNSGLTNAPVLCLEPDINGNMWIGTARGMNSLSPSHVFTTYKHATVPLIPYDGIQDIATAPNGDVWIIFISTKGILKFPGGSAAQAIFYKQDTIPNMPKDYIMNLTIDHNGNLWAGMKTTGVVRINGSGATVFDAGNTPAIHSNIPNKIAVDVCGNVWVASQHGVAVYDGSSWTDMPIDVGHIPNEVVLTLAVDSRGHVWFGTYGGLIVFKPLPQKTQLISPQMSMTMNADSVQCRWEWNCPGILKYWYEIADNPDFTNSRIDTTSPSLMASASIWERGLPNNSTWYWRIKAKNDAGWGPFSNTWIFYVNIPSGVATQNLLQHCELGQNYPNPCTDKTTIGFSLTKHESISLTIYDVLGRECIIPLQGEMGPGSFTVPIDVGALLHNGMYIYRLSAGNDMVQRTMHVMR